MARASSLPDNTVRLRDLVPRSLRERNVTLIVEPFATVAPTPACLRASFDAGVSQACADVDVLTRPGALRAVAAQVEKDTGLQVSGAYLQSFGATRTLSALAGVLRDRWVVLESPAPVPGASAVELMRDRREAILRRVVSGCEGASCASTVSGNLLDILEDGSGRVSGRELAVGLIAATTIPGVNEELVAEVREDVLDSTLTKEHARRLRALGRSYEGKRPSKQVSASMVALWADTCPRLRGWDELAKEQDPILAAFAWVFRGCSLFASVDDVEVSEPLGERVDALILTGTEDPIVPASLQERWGQAVKAQGGTTRTLVGAGHFWEDDAVTATVQRFVSDRLNRP
ncbi:hypothetical protein JK386_00870 [Nocardioides sp. zg-536]|uniref:Alpha/beta hydrolase n=1 Tax=Nocardioides faecalis TaxID=2803858 RepID=A0A938Y3B2_9ACTN|nr:hypothetical protein [Nocardioides faecalis]MBM9458450.1 hypothetical protein [Nocardioides faecalis]QVI58465.1 hypothetical protein KG111_15960 [Nocardioides faecalis]